MTVVATKIRTLDLQACPTGIKCVRCKSAPSTQACSEHPVVVQPQPETPSQVEVEAPQLGCSEQACVERADLHRTHLMHPNCSGSTSTWDHQTTQHCLNQSWFDPDTSGLLPSMAMMAINSFQSRNYRRNHRNIRPTVEI